MQQDEAVTTRLVRIVEAVVRDLDDGGIHSVGCRGALSTMLPHWVEHLETGNHGAEIISADLSGLIERLRLIQGEIERRVRTDAQGLYVALPTGAKEVSLYSVWDLAAASAQVVLDRGAEHADPSPFGLAQRVLENEDCLMDLAYRCEPVDREAGHYDPALANLRLRHQSVLAGSREVLRYFGLVDADVRAPQCTAMRG